MSRDSANEMAPQEGTKTKRENPRWEQRPLTLAEYEYLETTHPFALRVLASCNGLRAGKHIYPTPAQLIAAEHSGGDGKGIRKVVNYCTSEASKDISTCNKHMPTASTTAESSKMQSHFHSKPNFDDDGVGTKNTRHSWETPQGKFHLYIIAIYT